MAKNEVAKKDDGALSYDYGIDAAMGFEDITGADLSIPFINVLQPTSPQVQSDDGEYRTGMMLNTVTGEVMPQPMLVQPVYREELWVHWKPRKQGGGLVTKSLPTDPFIQELIKKNGGSRIPPRDAEGDKIQFRDDDGNEVVETHYVYCLVLDETGEESEGFCVLSFSSTKIKPYRDWITSMMMVKGKPPIIAFRALISTEKLTNDSGTYANYRIKPFKDKWTSSLIAPGHPLLEEALNFRKMIDQGSAKVQGETSEAPASGSSDEIPF